VVVIPSIKGVHTIFYAVFFKSTHKTLIVLREKQGCSVSQRESPYVPTSHRKAIREPPL